MKSEYYTILMAVLAALILTGSGCGEKKTVVVTSPRRKAVVVTSPRRKAVVVTSPRRKAVVVTPPRRR